LASNYQAANWNSSTLDGLRDGAPTAGGDSGGNYFGGYIKPAIIVRTGSIAGSPSLRLVSDRS
jgi:hypothetical protein